MKVDKQPEEELFVASIQITNILTHTCLHRLIRVSTSHVHIARKQTSYLVVSFLRRSKIVKYVALLLSTEKALKGGCDRKPVKQVRRTRTAYVVAAKSFKAILSCRFYPEDLSYDSSAIPATSIGSLTCAYEDRN